MHRVVAYGRVTCLRGVRDVPARRGKRCSAAGGHT